MSPAGGTHPIPGRQPVFEALRAGRRMTEVVVEAGNRELDGLSQGAEAAHIPVRRTTRDELDTLAHGVRHQGVVALARGFPYRALDEITPTDLVVVLDGVTDPQNLGAIARSALQAGAGALVLPKRRSVGVGPAAEKASAGALSWLQVALVPNLVRALADLAEQGMWSVGLDRDAPETLWQCALLDERVVVVIGAEGRGLSRLVRERVDALVSVPMRGPLGSLNAGVAAALALFEVVRRRAAGPA
ncbi:MAG: 23S rRNA (guanosine(2251)-2'-O)-methyltransferase RlmB [Euzebyales bacterium]|nr:23S rRNA (guanosine(2251)-2'-O)-methyltransferase RlmB [Euzebyales bacterium]